jgi:hypothetical protein
MRVPHDTQAQKEGNQVFDFLSSDNALLEAEKKMRDGGFTMEQLALLEEEEAMVSER